MRWAGGVGRRMQLRGDGRRNAVGAGGEGPVAGGGKAPGERGAERGMDGRARGETTGRRPGAANGAAPGSAVPGATRGGVAGRRACPASTGLPPCRNARASARCTSTASPRPCRSAGERSGPARAASLPPAPSPAQASASAASRVANVERSECVNEPGAQGGRRLVQARTHEPPFGSPALPSGTRHANPPGQGGERGGIDPSAASRPGE